MDTKHGQQDQFSEPAELETSPENKPTSKSKHLTPAQIDKLEAELGIKRRYAIVDKHKTEIGEGIYFDTLIDEDPTGASARQAFEWLPVVIDLGEQADRAMFDGQIFFHGHTYKIRRYRHGSFMETMAASQRHDAEVNGRARGLRNTERRWKMGRDGRAIPTT